MPRCPNCIDSEPLCLYCPACQFVVSPKAALITSNTCPRNCLLCPECGANTLVVNDGQSYAVKCAVCDFVYTGLEKRSFAAQISEKMATKKHRAYLEQRYLASPTPQEPEEPSSLEAEQDATNLPQLVKLVSRKSRICKACRHVLVKPAPEPGPKFLVKSMAVGMVPTITVYESKFMLQNKLPIPVTVKLSSQDVSFASTVLNLGAYAGNSSEEFELIQQVPEIFISRQSDFSRQVFMSGARKQAEFGEQGPNWVAVNFERHSAEKSEIFALCELVFESHDRTHQINMWVKF